MEFDRLPALPRIPTVSVVPDVGQTHPDNRKRREQPHGGHAPPQDDTSPTQPVVNIDGQLTGRLIDTTA